jgi:hypothetical protein
VSEEGRGLVERLVRRLAGIREEALRTGAVRLALADEGPVRVYEVLAVVCAETHRPRSRCAALGRALDRLVDGGGFGYQVTSEVYRIAHAQGDHAVMRFLLRSRRAEAREDDGGGGTTDPMLSALTLGERKSLARRFDRDLLARIARDPDPEVIRNLLRNPRLTEHDVVRIAARRPAPPEILVEVWRCERWSRRHAVRRALAFNPGTPAWTVHRILPSLLEQELRQVRSDPLLAPEVREAAAMLLRA